MTNVFIKISFVATVVAALLSGANGFAQSCFDPKLDPTISRVLTPDPKFAETPESLEMIHRLIWEHRRELDPRLVYHRMVGESLGDPFVMNKRSGAYGLFQFEPGNGVDYPNVFRRLYRRYPNLSPRYIQVRYYLEVYLQRFKTAANAGYGCNRQKPYSHYSNLEKVTYLGFGSCSMVTFQKELSLCSKVVTYRNGACRFSHEAIFGRRPRPVCDYREGGGLSPAAFGPSSQLSAVQSRRATR
jgi:hypothetical protein